MKTLYEQRTDLEKIQSQWYKITVLLASKQWSAAIVRAATAAELAANFAIRDEFQSRSKFKPEFVDSLLRWANGLAGKMNNLLTPLTVGKKRHKTIKKLKVVAAQINKKRNPIAHQGEFSKKAAATAVIEQARTFIETLVQLYEPEFVLKDKKR